MQTRPKLAAREETALFPEVERANTFLFWKTNVRKIH